MAVSPYLIYYCHSVILLMFIPSHTHTGADINFTDKHGQTCLHEISRDWHTDVAQFALTRGADVNKSDNYGRTPLHLASAVNYPEMVYWLISNGGKKRKT